MTAPQLLSPSRRAVRSVVRLPLVGLLLWLVVCAILRPPFEIAILLFAPLVLVPMGLTLLESPLDRPHERSLLRWANRLAIIAALPLAVSFRFEQGSAAAWWAVPWLLLTLLLATIGLFRLARQSRRVDADLAITAALLMIPVGSGWAVTSRAGLRPQDFSPAIVLLTAVHFHYAGFVLPLLAGLAIQAREGSAATQASWADSVMVISIIAGVPLVGVGITLSPHVEVAAALLLVLGSLLLALKQFQAALVTRDSTCLALASVSSMALVSAMGLAAVYAVGEFLGREWIDIAAMIRTHGFFNAFGFAACGLGCHIYNQQTNARK